jgi:hypothetical protein
MKGGDFSWPPVGTFRGHQWGPQLATSEYFLMATDRSGKACGKHACENFVQLFALRVQLKNRPFEHATAVAK